jgi:biotin carboxyl carrier protein
MRYFVSVGESTVEVEIDGAVVRVAGREVVAELRAVPDSGVRHLLVDGRSVLISADAVEGGAWDIALDGQRFRAEVLDERTRTIREMTGRAAGPRGPKPVRAPMPGMIVRIEVAPGDTVRTGQGIVIVEAMKMENELKAEGDGVVGRILVEPGQAVEKGAVLVEFEAP